MYCALCKKQIDMKIGFSNPKSHEPGCPMFTDTQGVADIVIEATEEKVIRDRINSGK